MRISDIYLYRYTLPLKTDHMFSGSLQRRIGLLLRIDTDTSCSGWGEAAPLPGFSHDTVETAENVLHRASYAMKGMLLDHIDNESILSLVLQDIAAPSPSAAFAVESAILECRARSLTVPMQQILSDRAVSSIPLCALIMSGTGDECVVKLYEEGWRTFKIKAGGSPLHAANRVCHLSSILGNDVLLRLDVNRCWNLEEALAFAHHLPTLPIEYIEEPVQCPSDLGCFQRQSGLPIALDETLAEMGERVLNILPTPGVFVLKPTILGGIIRCLDFARKAYACGAYPVISAAYESGIGILVNARLSAALCPEHAAGLDTYRYLQSDVLKPELVFQGGHLRLTDIASPVVLESLQEVFHVTCT